MASLGKKEFAKRDMNFFSEFTASSQAYAKAAGVSIIVALVVIALTVLVCIMKFINYAVIDKQVKDYDELFRSPEYVNLKIEAQQLSEESATIHRYSYVVSSMKTNIEKDKGVSYEIIKNIESNIPSNVILTGYTVNEGEVLISGESLTYQAPNDMLNLLKQHGLVFARENMDVARVAPNDIGDADTFVHNYINAKYTFTFEGSLKVDHAIKISYVGPGSTILKNLETQWKKSGEICTIEPTATLTANGQDYTLDSILVNGKAISADELLKAQKPTEANPGGVYKLYVTDDTKVDLHYVLATINTTTEEAK